MLEVVRNALRRQGAEYAGGGMYASVYFHDADTVVKLVSESDGTRNWLEFCAYHTAVGTATRMMPRVEAVYPVLTSAGVGYIAVMERLEEQNCSYEHEVRRDDGLAKADFVAYVETMRLWKIYWHGVLGQTEHHDYFFNDLHSGNIMRRGDDVVITDPSCCGYFEPVASPDWTLE